jgi:murein L,D-transpeptidase YcbB/YkuD
LFFSAQANECAESPKYDTKKSASALSSVWERGARGMHRGYLFAVLLFACQASAWAGPSPDTGKNAASATSVTKSPGERAVQTDPVIPLIRSKLAGRGLSSNADPADIAALQAFYGNSSAARLWITDMGLSARAQTALFEIERANDWGLDAAAFELPPAMDLPTSLDEEATAEIKLDLAILKYARFARGGRLNPRELSGLFDQAPTLRDPRIVLMEIASARAPDAYLQSLHPKHEQFVRLRHALLKMRDGAGGNSTDINRIIINMERWRWMPDELGPLYVWSNTPEFMLYVVKDGKTIFADKTQVGTADDPTPVFSADMTTIVFNPEWIAPSSVLVKSLLPRLRKQNYSILDKYAFSVSYQGNPVNPTKIDWTRVNIRDYTFTQKPGPKSNLGKVKFLLPNRHDVLLHDTFAARRKVFQQSMRAIGYGCVRMERPDRFAEVLLAEDKGWSASEVNELWEHGVNSPVALDRKIPVHLTYFTAVVDDTGKVSRFADLYGLDKKLAMALFRSATAPAKPSSEIKKPREEAGAPAPPAQKSGINMDAASNAQIVAATWYGNEFRGSRTASGEVFNPEGLTAAHKSLPFGTCLVVGNPRTGRSVIVRVNDRGPFTEGMTLDLSAGAARVIGMHSTQKVSMKRC